MTNLDENASFKNSRFDVAAKDEEGSATSKIRSWIEEPLILFPVVATLVLAVIWGVTLNLIKVERTAAEDTAMLLSEELAETYEAQVIRVLREVDKALLVVKYAYEHKGEEEVLLQLKERELLPSDFLFTVHIADSSGEIVASTRPSRLTNIAEQDYFKSQLKEDLFAVGRPQMISNTDEWKLYFSRKLTSADGTFSGIVMISVDASFFVSGYESSKLGNSGVLAVLGVDGIFRAGRTGDLMFADIEVDYKNIVNESDRETRLSVNSWDGVQRYTSARQIYNFPLAVVVGLSADEQFIDTYRDKHVYLWRAVGVSFILVFIIIILIRLSRQLVLSRQRVIEEHVAHAQQIEHLAYHDELTKLPNRSLFTKLLVQNINHARRHDRQLAVMFLDLDGFKSINDTLGHGAGDQLLQEVAKRLKDCLRDSDSVARLGGDEFVALLPELDAEQYVVTVANKILHTVSQSFELLGKKRHVTASIGVSLFPRDGGDEQTLTKRADIAMYQAKEQGKNNYQLYSEKLNSKLIERLTLESNLRHALDREEFHLHYQAKWDAQNNRITGMEALLRWNNNELGEVKPMTFIPIAEETGLIIPIGKWVIEAACKQNVAWQDQNYAPITMAVNFTARQFYDKNLLEDLESILESSSMDAHLLEVGVRESSIMNDTKKTMKIFKRLKEMGIRIAIDDFGHNYASLATLKQFPLDTVKIDRSLICDVSSDTYQKELTESIIATGQSLSMTVLAQGIETSEQADFIRKQDCNEFQGFYFNKPVPSDQISELLKTHSNRVN